MTTVFGFDTSLSTTGVARLEIGFDADGMMRPFAWQTWRSTVAKPEVDTVRTMRRRMRLMLSDILTHVPGSYFDLAVVEGPAIGAKFAGLADERAGLRWMLIDQLLGLCGDVVLVPPKTRALIAADNGNADKRMVLNAVRASHPHINVADDNVADAITLAEIGAHRLGMRLDLSTKQEKGLAKLAGL